MKKPRTLTVLARTWFDRQNGNTYHSAQVYLDNRLVAVAPFTYGYGSQWEYSAASALDDAKIFRGNKARQDGHEPIWQWSQRLGLVTLLFVADCRTKKECVQHGAARVD